MQITLLPHEEAIWQKTLWLIVIILMLQLKDLMLQGQLFQKKMAFHLTVNALLCRRDSAIAIDVHASPFWLKDNERHF